MKDWNSEEFVRLVTENPKLPIMPMVDTECVQDDGHGWWAADLGKPMVDEYYVDDERIYLKSCDLNELQELFIDNNFDEEPYNSMDDEQLEQVAEEVVAGYEWTKAIMLPVEPQ